MELYLYNAQDKTIISKIGNVLSYTDNEIVAEEDVYSPLAEGVELSATADCAGALRADWRRGNPPAETRLEELETLMAEILFGGNAAAGGETV